MSTNSSSGRRWTLLAGLLALAVVLGSLAWFAGHARDTGGPARPSGVARPELPAEVGLESGSLESPGRVSGSTAPTALTVDGLVIPVGVRLAGDGRLTGRVLERGTARPIAGARVDLWGVPPSGSNLLGRIVDLAGFSQAVAQRVKPVATQATGGDGTFSFAGVRTGRYFLEARGARHVIDALESVLVTSADEVTDSTLWVRAGGRVTGRVESASGVPVADAHVFVFPGPGAVLREAATGDVRLTETRTERDGSFVVAGVPPGSGYDLAVDAKVGVLTHVMDLTVTAGADTPVAVVLREGGAIEGRVLFAESEDAEPVPVAGANVCAVPRGLRDLHFAAEVLKSTHDVTDADGRYRLKRVPSGEFDVVAVGAGYRPTLGPRARVVEGLTVTAGDLLIESGPTVRVHVLDEEGTPLAGVSASWWVVDWNDFEFEISLTPFLLQAAEGFAYPVTDAEGWVTVGPFAGDDTQRFVLYKPGLEYRTVRWNPETDEPELEIKMRRPSALEGIVIDAEAAKPITSFTLFSPERIEPREDSPAPFNPYSGGVLVEHAKGKFRLAPMRAGNVSLSVWAPGYVASRLEDLELTAGETKRGVIVKLSRGGVVEGQVIDEDGEPVAGAQVQAVDERGKPALADFSRSPRLGAEDPMAEFNQELGMGLMDVASQLGVLGPGAVVSGPEGEFRLEGLNAGTWVLRAKHRDFSGAEEEKVTLELGGSLDGVDLVLRRGGTLTGTITDRFDRPVAGAIVLAASTQQFGGNGRGDMSVFMGSTGLFQGMSNGEGDYTIEHLPGGSYFVSVTRGDAQLNPLSFLGTLNFDLISVASEGETRCDMVDSSMGGVRVFGRVTAGGLPVARGGLFALGFESENLLGVDVKIAQVQADGSYEFAGLAPGGYRFNYGGSSGPDASFDVEVPDLPEVRLDFELPSGSLSGIVRGPDGSPIDAVGVSLARVDSLPSGTGLLGSLLSAEGRSRSARTDEDGRFLFGELEAGTYQVTAGTFVRRRRDERNWAPSEPLTVELRTKEQRDDLAFELAPALTISGRVVDEQGQPVPKVSVRAWQREALASRGVRARTDESGAFTLEGLSRAIYDVGAEGDDHAEARLQTVDLTTESNPVVELRLERGVELVVWVTDEVGRAVSGATARVEPIDGRAAPGSRQAERVLEGFLKGEGVSGPDGKLELGRFATGAWRVEILLGDRRGVREATLSGDRTDLDVQIGDQDS